MMFKYYSFSYFLDICDIVIETFKLDWDYEKIKKKKKLLIFCKQDAVHFSVLLEILKLIKQPFILISGMDDFPITKKINKKIYDSILNHPTIKHWFCINNLILDNNLITGIPYGLDFWTLTRKKYFMEPITSLEKQNAILIKISKQAKHFKYRIPLIYANFNLNLSDKKNGNYREKLQTIIPKDIICYQEEKISRTNSWKIYTKFAFIVSPFGNGFDCIRTFEALCLGCIVIMKKCFLENVYKDLPVLFVDNWEDINEELLKNTLEKYSKTNFKYEKLSFEYWYNLILNKYDT